MSLFDLKPLRNKITIKFKKLLFIEPCNSSLIAAVLHRRLSDLLNSVKPMAYIPTEENLPAAAKRALRMNRRYLAAAFFMLALTLAGIGSQGTQPVPPGMSRLDFTIERMQRSVEPAIYIGGIFVSRSRNTIAAGMMGCAAGAGTGAAIAGGLSRVSGGLALPSVPLAGALGCGFGALGGAALGRPLDDYASF